MPSIWATALLLLPATISALTLDCKHIEVDKQKFNLAALGGPRTVHNIERSPPSITNTTFTLDICATLKKSSDKNIPANQQCPGGTRVCAIERDYDPSNPELPVSLHKVIPIAGDFTTSHGRGLEPKIERLKDGKSNEDAKREGLRIELHGGKYPEDRTGKLQKAIIEFVCDHDLTGNEGFPGVDALGFEAMQKRADKEDDEDNKDDDKDDDDDALPDLDKGKSLQYVSYKPEGEDDTGVLRLTWKTKYACEGEADNAPSKPPSGGEDSDGKKSSGWGFFTWFIIIFFLLAASYIIFGSWLNYNRYGARGWDLVPHGDAIRDMPYLVREWSGNVVDRIRGSGGSRGGYSAV